MASMTRRRLMSNDFALGDERARKLALGANTDVKQAAMTICSWCGADRPVELGFACRRAHESVRVGFVR
jgi:hypothetical protein